SQNGAEALTGLARAFFYARENFAHPLIHKLTSRTAVAGILALYCLGMWIVHPIAESYDSRERSPKETVRRTLEIADRDKRPLLYYDMNDPKLYFYVRRIIANYEESDGEKVVTALREHPNTIVFGEEDTMRQLTKAHPDMQFRELLETPEKLRQVPYELVAFDPAKSAQ
ncbi:MAG TPA: hypothetical protein PK988_05905, partial [Candidatus Sumerlaeota bacterium]|nr:hypothetical protein [Candidatus Sumerlaeota bacterium]